MKKHVLIFGLLAGAVVATLMIISISIGHSGDSFGTGSMVLGYASMVLAFSFLFVGIKNYRDKYNQGAITFGKAFLMGLYMTLIASTIYVIAWMVDYYLFMPDFMDRYIEHALKEMAENGASPEKIKEQAAEMEGYKKLYATPFGVAAMTYMEILPVGLLMTLLAAAILRRKPKDVANSQF